jgi:hypothetical protein
MNLTKSLTAKENRPALSLVPTPREYSQPDTAPDAAVDELDPFDSFVLLLRALYEVEVLSPAVGKCDAKEKRAPQQGTTAKLEWAKC